MKSLIFLSHCILNKSSKVFCDEHGLDEEYKIRNQLLKLILKKDIQVVQLPCPEFILYGSRRWGHVKDQFEHPFFKEQCKKMLSPIITQIIEYKSYPNDYNVIGIVSVEGSPSCGYKLSCRGNWGGELESNLDLNNIINSVRISEEPGVFFETLSNLLQINNINVDILTMMEAVEKINLLGN